MMPGVSLQHTGSAREALRHFGTAYVFFILGLLFLVFNSHFIATGGARAPQVVSSLHFITLGWLSLSVFGALQVFTSVALGGIELNPKLAPYARMSLSLALFLFVFSLYLLKFYLLLLALFFILLGLLLYTFQITPALLKASRGALTRFFIIIAFVSLWCVFFLGLNGALLKTGFTPILKIIPTNYLESHILLAFFGWMGSMVIGVGSHLVPMFSLSKETTKLPLKITLFFWMLIPLMALLGAYFGKIFLIIGWGAAFLGSLTWGFQFNLYIKNRIRKENDPGLLITKIATIFLLLSWALFFFLKKPEIGIASFLLGWLSLFTLGIFHRVLPFLSWFVKFSKPVKGVRPPRVKDLIDDKLARIMSVSYPVGFIIFITGFSLHHELTCFMGSLIMFLTAIIGLGHLRALYGKKPLTKFIFKGA